MDTAQFYTAARSAQIQWAKLEVGERLRRLTQFRRLIADRAEELAEALERVSGKPQFEALTAEILTVADTIKYWERHGERILKDRRVKTPLLLAGRRSWIEYRPRGVVLVIAPWNYPFQLSLIPSLAALLAGNAVILKPSEVTGALDTLFAQLFQDSGFPEDLVTVVSGDGAVGAALVAGEPDLIFFTGSVATGKKIQEQAARRLIPTILELGGKDAMIILEDAPLERAVQGALWGAYTNSGQVCLSTERILVHQDLYAEFVARFKKEVEALQLGRMTSPAQVAVVREQVEEALAQGAQLAAGVPPSKWIPDSLTLPPLVLTGVGSQASLSRGETFGPVVTITPFAREEEAVRLANSTSYGLGASVWSRDLQRARQLARQLQVGNISINDTMITVANPFLPFGGVKESGLGSYHGEQGLLAFCTSAAVMESGGRRRTELNWFPYTPEKKELLVELLKKLYGTTGSWRALCQRALRFLCSKN